MKTVFSTNIRGAYEGETYVAIGDDGERKLSLRIATYKSYSKQLVTHASVVERTAYGFQCNVFQDFSQAVITTKPARITKKAIEEQHLQALESVDSIVVAAQMHHNLMPELA